VLVRRVGGGRLAAREVVLNTPTVAAAISEGKTLQLPAAIEGGRRYGMMSLNESLAALVQKGAVDPREAYRASEDRMGLLAAFERLGLDTSFVDRRV
jgi:twitching motility protein PilT